jgi:threonine/homoserine/homoserine lactone efflux protein
MSGDVVMIDGSLYAAFLVAAVVLVLTPGPDMLFILTMGIRGGASVGFAAALGVAVGLGVHTAAAVLGLSALFAAVPSLYHLMRWLGAAYLVYLAVKAFRDRGGLSPTPVDAPAPGEPAARRPGVGKAFRTAVAVNVLNPKVILFNVAFLPQFVAPEMGHVWGQFLVLGLTITVMGVVVDGLTGLLSGKLSALLRRSRRVARGLNIFSGSVFTGLAVRLVVSSPK